MWHDAGAEGLGRNAVAEKLSQEEVLQMDNHEARHDLIDRRQNVASSETEVEFRPSLVAAARELLIGGVVFSIVVAVGLFVFKGVSSVLYAIVFGMAAGALVVGFYVVRFTRRAPHLVRVDDNGLSIWRREDETSVAWTDVREAIHEDSYGLRWRLKVGAYDVVLRDDGFGTSQWDKLSKAIQANLSHRGISVAHEGLASAFDESDGDAGAGSSG